MRQTHVVTEYFNWSACYVMDKMLIKFWDSNVTPHREDFCYLSFAWFRLCYITA